MIAPRYYDRPQPGWEMLTRGIYIDAERQMHLFPGEFLVANGYRDTPANREVVEKMMKESIRGMEGGADVPITDMYPEDK